MKKKIKLLIVQSYASQTGGPITFIHLLVKHIDLTKFEPMVLFLSQGKLVEEFRAKGVRTTVINSGRLRNIPLMIFTILRIFLFIHRYRVDIVFSNDYREHIYAGTAAYIRGIPAVIFIHGFFSTSFFIRLSLSIPSNFIITPSDFFGRAIKQFMGKRTICKTIYPGIEIPERNEISKENARAKLGIDSGQIVSMVAVLMPIKGHKYFIESAGKIIQKFPRCKFLIVGDTPFDRFIPYRDELKKYVKTLGLSDYILFLGHRTDVLSIISASDVLVHPIISPESFGFVIIEAMATCTPVVASKIGEAEFLINDGKEGFLVLPKDPESIASAVIRILSSSELQKNMGNAGREKVEKNFTAQRMVKEIESVLIESLRIR